MKVQYLKFNVLFISAIFLLCSVLSSLFLLRKHLKPLRKIDEISLNEYLGLPIYLRRAVASGNQEAQEAILQEHKILFPKKAIPGYLGRGLLTIIAKEKAFYRDIMNCPRLMGVEQCYQGISTSSYASYDIAEELFKQAYSNGCTMALYYLGFMSYGLGKIEESKRYFKQSIEVTKNIHCQRILMMALVDICSSSFKENKKVGHYHKLLSNLSNQEERDLEDWLRRIYTRLNFRDLARRYKYRSGRRSIFQ